MKGLQIARPGERLSVLCLGAHSDDIEIGAGGLLLNLLERNVKLDVAWCVLSASGEREKEARNSAAAFLSKATSATIETMSFRDTLFPVESEKIKSYLEDLKMRVTPDLIITHHRDDGHQDHREVCRLTWNTFRNHLIWEYEIPKWDGDLGQPNLYVPISTETLERKLELLNTHFGTQRSKDWFDAEVFRSLARLRGMECRASEGYAEAFYTRKLSIS